MLFSKDIDLLIKSLRNQFLGLFFRFCCLFLLIPNFLFFCYLLYCCYFLLFFLLFSLFSSFFYFYYTDFLYFSFHCLPHSSRHLIIFNFLVNFRIVVSEQATAFSKAYSTSVFWLYQSLSIVCKSYLNTNLAYYCRYTTTTFFLSTSFIRIGSISIHYWTFCLLGQT